ncbi:MAG: rhodanese-like domain-containing protein, partial [Ignavibacteria bacterium]
IALATIFISFTAFLMPERQSDILSRASDKNVLNTFHPEKMTVDEFAFRIIDGDRKLNIVDLRSKEDFTQMSLPNSVNMNYENLFGKDAAKTFSKKNASYVIIANTEDEETKAAYIAREIGYENVYVLSDGMNGFRDNVINFKAPQNIGTRHESDLYKFREKASILIPEIIKENKNKGVQENKESKRALGGC